MAKKRKKSASTDTIVVKPLKKAPGRNVWRLMDRGSSIAAGLLAQRASAMAWRAATGKKPPTSGRHPDVTTREAVAWAVVGGAIIELVKVSVRRNTATYWVKSTGQLPPGMKPLVKAPGTTKEPVPPEPAPARTPTKVSRRSRGR
ncbi:MAG: hypothetical protein JWP31_364 [Aeromicrobium sp.]|nr:hypothetical protein [Aeromicrobium sp.]